MNRFIILLIVFLLPAFAALSQEYHLTNGEVYLHEDTGAKMVTLGDKLTKNSYVSSKTIFRLARTYDGKTFKSAWYEKSLKPTVVSNLKKSHQNVAGISDYKTQIRGQRDTMKYSVALQLVSPVNYQEYEIVSSLHEGDTCCFEICNMSDYSLECILFQYDNDGIYDLLEILPEKVKFTVKPQSVTVLPQPEIRYMDNIKEFILVSSSFFLKEEHELMCKLAKSDVKAFYDYINQFSVSVISFR